MTSVRQSSSLRSSSQGPGGPCLLLLEVRLDREMIAPRCIAAEKVVRVIFHMPSQSRRGLRQVPFQNKLGSLRRNLLCHLFFHSCGSVLASRSRRSVRPLLRTPRLFECWLEQWERRWAKSSSPWGLIVVAVKRARRSLSRLFQDGQSSRDTAWGNYSRPQKLQR